jgi:hypothetical protein
MKNVTLRNAVMAAGLSASALLSGCGGGAQVAQGCTYPDAPEVPAENWICDGPAQGAVTAVDSHLVGAAGSSFAKQMAMTKARVQLAQMMKVRVQNQIKIYAGTTGAASTETVDQVAQSTTNQITSETLVGTRIFKSKVSPAHTMYVLVGIDPENVQKVAEKAISTSMNNERALWQQFKAAKGHEELAAEIAKIEAKEAK